MFTLSAFWSGFGAHDGNASFVDVSPARMGPHQQDVPTERGAPLLRHGGDPDCCFSSAAYSLSGRYVVLTATTHKGGRSRQTEKAGASWLAKHLDSLGIVTALQCLDPSTSAIIWDRSARTLAVARDRFGRAALYYGWNHGVFSVSARPDDLIRRGSDPEQISRDGLALLLKYGYIPSPHTIYDNVWKVEAGTIQFFTELDASSPPSCYDHAAGRSAFWSAAVLACSTRPAARTLREAADSIDALLHRSIDGMADPNTVCMLSGGVDSGIIAAAYQHSRATQVETFSIGFADTNHRVDAGARDFARVLGTAHTHVDIEERDVPALVNHAIAASDEPMADSSLIPTLAAFRLASHSSSSVLTGEGGDELFMGSHSYSKAAGIAAWVNRVPSVLRKVLARPYASSEMARLGGIAAVLSELQSSTLERAFEARISKWRNPEQLVIHSRKPATICAPWSAAARLDHPARHAQLMDFMMDLREGQLSKIRIASAAAQISARPPFLEPSIYDLAWSLPHTQLLHQGHHKYALKHLLSRYIPEDLIFRPKVGFGSPVAEWLAGPLRDWAEQLLDRRLIEEDGLLRYDRINDLWRQFKDGQRKWHSHLWPVLVFLAWRAGRRQRGAD